MDTASSNQLRSRATDSEHQCPNWTAEIKQKAVEDNRSRPWKKNFGTPSGNLDDEDWINYPSVQNMAKKGIRG